MERLFLSPWSVEKSDACFIVRDHNGQKLAYVYFEDEPGRRSAAKLLERDEARRIAVKIANAGATEPPSNWSRLRVSAANKKRCRCGGPPFRGRSPRQLVLMRKV